MADVQSNIKVSIDTSEALAQLKLLQREISAFHTSMAKNGASGAAVSANMQQNLLNQINAAGQFRASLVKVQSTTEAFNTALAKNQFGMREYFRYAGAATKTFGSLFKNEFNTINKVATENVKTLQTQYIKMGRDASGAMKAMSIRPLALDMSNYGTQTQIAAQRQMILNQLLRQGSTNLLNFGKNTQWAGRQLMVGFSVPLLYIGAAAAKTFMTMEQQAINFKRVYGNMFTTTSEVDKALKDVQALANTFTQYGVAVADTLGLAAKIAATGKQGVDLTNQLSAATKLSVLGQIDQQKALDTIISLTSTFGTATEDLTKNIDFLNAVENQTILNIEDLTIAIPKAAPVVKQLGGDVKDLAFFMTAMREGGIDAAQGANAIKSVLASMINPTKSASSFLAGFGINLQAIVNGDKGNVRKMVVDLATSLDKLDPLNRAQAIEKMFGKFQFARASTLFQNVIKQGSQAQQTLELTKATAEELAILSQRELSKVSDSPMYKFKKEVQDLKTTLVPLGAEFIKALTPVIKFVGGILKGFNGLSDGVKSFITKAVIVLAGIGPILLMSIGLLANGIANIIKLFVGIKSIFNRTGQASLSLGEQTDYLTQKQMDAAAVASSLDQAHMQLEQRFTSEASAVQRLAIAYEEAILAQRSFGAMPMVGRGAMKFAGGVVSVPGPKGAGDIVPAMLSPGESVINSKSSAKYAPLLSAINSDKVPGYINGRTQSGNPYALSHVAGFELSGAQGLGASIQSLQTKFQALSDTTSKEGLALKELIDQTLRSEIVINEFNAKVNGVNTGLNAVTGTIADLNAQGLRAAALGGGIGGRIATTYRNQALQRIGVADPIFASQSQNAAALAQQKLNQNNQLIATNVQRESVGKKALPVLQPQIEAELKALIAEARNFTTNAEKAAYAFANMEKTIADQIVSVNKNISQEELATQVTQRMNSLKQDLIRTGAAQMDAEQKNIIALHDETAQLVFTSNQLRAASASGVGAVIATGSASPQMARLAMRGDVSGETVQKPAGWSRVKMPAARTVVQEATSGYGAAPGVVSPATLARLDAMVGQTRAVVEATINEIVSAWQTETDAAARSMIANTKRSFGIASPSRHTEEVAVALVQGFDKGIQETRGQVVAEGEATGQAFAAGARTRRVATSAGGDPATMRAVAGPNPVTVGNVSQSTRRAAGWSGGAPGQGIIYNPAEKTLQQAQAEAAKMLKDRAIAEEQAAEAARKKAAADRRVLGVSRNVALSEEQVIEANKLRAAAQRRVLGITTEEALTEEQLALANKRLARQRILTLGKNPYVPPVPGQGMAGAGSAMMAVSMVAMMGSMLPGKLGELSQKIMMVTMALGMMFTMLKTQTSQALGALAIGIAVMIAAYVSYRRAVDKARDAALEQADATIASSNAMKALSIFAHNVTGNEVMNTRRSSQNRQYETAVGKTTFGESYVGSKEGKDQVKTLIAKTGNQGLATTEGDLQNQLLSGIASGALSAQQAKSLALNLGQQMHNMSLGLRISAKVDEMFGPNGENLLKEGVSMRVKLVEDNRTRMNQRSENARKQMGWRGSEAKSVAGWTVGGAAAGAATGAIVGSMIPIVGTAIGAGVGAIVGGVAGYFKGKQERGKRVAALAAYDVSNQGAALAQQQQMIDALQVDYEKRIASAKAAGDTAEADRLQNEYIKARQRLLNEGAKTSKDIMKNFGKADEALKAAYESSIDKMVTKKYKGTAMEDAVPLAMQNIADSKMTREQKVLFKLQMAEGNIDPATTINLMNLVGSDKKSSDYMMNILTKAGGPGLASVDNLLGFFQDGTGKVDTALQLKIMAEIGEKKTGAEQEGLTKYLTSIAQAGGELDISALITYYDTNQDGAAGKGLKTAMDLIEKNDGKLDIKVLTQIMPPEYLNPEDKAYFEGLSQAARKVYLQELAVYTNITDEVTFNKDPEVIKWLETTDGQAYKGKDYVIVRDAFANYMGKKKTQSMPATDVPEGGPQQQQGNKPSSSPLDDIIKKLRDLRQLQIGLTTGWAASWKAMDKYFSYNKKTGKAEMSKSLLSKKGEFMGLAPQLRKQGANEAAIDFITGLSPEDYKKQQGKLFAIQKDGSIKLLAEGKKLNLALQAIAVGNFANTQDKVIKSVNDQSQGFTKLIALGYNTEQAYKALSDAEFANAVASGNMKDADLKAAMAKQILADKVQAQLDHQKALDGYLKGIKDAFNDEAAFSKLALQLSKMGYATEDIAKILGDPNIAKGFIDKIAAGKLDAAAIAQSLKDLKNTQIQGTVTKINSKDYAAAFQPGYDAANKLFDIKSRMLDVEYRGILANDQAAVDSLQMQIDGAGHLYDANGKLLVNDQSRINDQQKLIDAQGILVDDAQKNVDIQQKLIEAQNTRNDKLSHDLKLIDKSAQDITEKYDKQKTALEEVASINSIVAGQQQKQLTLADALSQGDISAAAKAAQDMRAQQAADALATQQKSIDKARDLELARLINDEGKTRKQIEDEQYLISEKIYSIQENGLKNAQTALDTANANLKTAQDLLIPLEKAKADHELLLKKAQDKLDADNKALETAKQNITVLGQTKQQWDDMKMKVDAAMIANDSYMAGALAGSLATAKVVDDTWATITGKLADYFAKDKSSITIKEIHEIYEVIMGQTGAQKQAPPPPPETPKNPGNIDAVNTQVADEQKKLLDSIANGTKTDVTPSSIANDMATALLSDKAATAALGGVSGVLSTARYTGQGLQYAAQLAAKAKAQAEADAKAAAAAATKALMSGGGADAAFDRKTGYSRYAMGGMVGNYLAGGGFGMRAVGTDTVPAMLTPGEFIVTKYGVQNFGINNLRAINAGSKTSSGDSVYTYNLSVNVKSDASPDDIAKKVIAQIRQIDSQRIRGNNL